MKRISLIMIIILLLGLLIGCSQQVNMPEGFENEELYNDLSYVLTIAESDLKNMKLTHPIAWETEEEGEIYNRILEYEEGELTSIEGESLELVWEILVKLDVYVNSNGSSLKSEIENHMNELSNIIK